MQKKFWIDRDYGKLSAILQTLDGKNSYPLVMILDGFTSNKQFELLTTVADKLEVKGIASLLFDFNGHGESEGRFQDMTVLNEIEYAKKVYAYAKTISEATSISILGHSQGGVVSSMVAGELGTDAFANVVLMALAAVLREDSARGVLFGVTFNSAEPSAYIDINIYASYRVGREYIKVAAQLPIFKTASKYEDKVCVIHGTKTAKFILDHGFSQDVEHAANVAVTFLVQNLC